MGDNKTSKSHIHSSTSPCAHLRAAYHNCFNRFQLLLLLLLLLFFFLLFKKKIIYLLWKRKGALIFLFVFNKKIVMYRWYSEKFVKGEWKKEECVSEWQKYRACLAVRFFSFLFFNWNIPSFLFS